MGHPRPSETSDILIPKNLNLNPNLTLNPKLVRIVTGFTVHDKFVGANLAFALWVLIYLWIRRANARFAPTVSYPLSKVRNGRHDIPNYAAFKTLKRLIAIMIKNEVNL